MTTHSRILAWEIPWTEEPGGLWSMGSQRVRHPGPSSECAPVSDPSPDASGPVDSRVPLLHPASPKMNVRRVESLPLRQT